MSYCQNNQCTDKCELFQCVSNATAQMRTTSARKPEARKWVKKICLSAVFLHWTIPRLQHPEVNSRRPGRFEVRLRASRKKTLILFKKLFPCSLVQVCRPLDAISLPLFAFFTLLTPSLSRSHTRSCSVSLRHRFYLSHAKVGITKKRICSALMANNHFVFRPQCHLKLPRRVRIIIDVWIYGSAAAEHSAKAWWLL